MGTRVLNPPWQRDELILVLELYDKHAGKHLRPKHGDVTELSRVLNELPIHAGHESLEKFRNPNAVSMKVLNFRRFDTGRWRERLTRGGKLEEQIWRLYASDRVGFLRLAARIRASRGAAVRHLAEEPDEEEFPEGRILYRLHRLRERDRRVIERAKDRARRRRGALACSVCSFDFAAVYGQLGEEYIEGHHTVPVSEFGDESTTRVSDIALVCSNCHRMLHRRRPWLGIDKLQSILLGPN